MMSAQIFENFFRDVVVSVSHNIFGGKTLILEKRGKPPLEVFAHVRGYTIKNAATLDELYKGDADGAVTFVEEWKG